MTIEFFKTSEKLPEINANFQWYRQYLCIESNGAKSICRFEPWSWRKEISDTEASFKTILNSEGNLLCKEKPEEEGWQLQYCFRESKTERCVTDVLYWADIHDLGVKDWKNHIVGL